MAILQRTSLNPSNAEATFVHNTKKQKKIENHLNPIMLVFIGVLSDEYPLYQ